MTSPIQREAPPLDDRGARRRGSNILAPTAFNEGGKASRSSDFTVFAAMPFNPSFEDVFHVGIKPAAELIGGTAIRVDQVMHGGDAVTATWNAIRTASVVIADVSTSEPDVLYELGLAHALRRPTLQICRTDYHDLPFMVRNRETLLYQSGRTYLLVERLRAYLQTLLTPTTDYDRETREDGNP